MGTKSENQKILITNNFSIPKFISFKILEKYEQKISILDKNKKYAVRSDMDCEDSSKSSFAGQFTTFINVDFKDILEKVQLIIYDAKSKKLENNEIGIIVQEYVDFDYSGIAFSRNPNGGYEINIEYHKGIGEDIVSGNITPEIIKFYHWENIKTEKFKKIEKIFGKYYINFIENIKKIEKIFDFPQDIEWGMKNGKFYFLYNQEILQQFLKINGKK